MSAFPLKKKVKQNAATVYTVHVNAVQLPLNYEHDDVHVLHVPLHKTDVVTCAFKCLTKLFSSMYKSSY